MKIRGFVDLGFAKIDIDREKRRGLPEIIYAPQKTTSQLEVIIKELKIYTDLIFITRLSLPTYKALKKKFPRLRYFKIARLAFLGRERRERRGLVSVITAGSSDISVAEEAAIFLELTGNRVKRIYDVGVAGLHRIKPFENEIKKAKVIIAVAGMEAALLSIISGLTSVPVIGVPTSVGYGTSLKGLSALLGMLNTCSLGSAVVNIDNGLGAGYFAHLINGRE
jgi:hypothetical protein